MKPIFLIFLKGAAAARVRARRHSAQQINWAQRIKPCFAGLFAGACFTSAHATPALDALKATLQKSLSPEVQIKSIAPSPIAGLYEVNLGQAILYSDAQGAYLLMGKLVDVKTMENLTDRRLAELNRIHFKNLPFVNAIKVVRGNGARQMAVFSDPNCRYCRELEHTLSKINNVTIYTFLFPILKPDSVNKAQAIWCAPNRSAAWQAWIAHHQTPNGKTSCNTDALAQNLALGRRLNVFSTPTVFFANGYRLMGAVTLDQLERALAAAGA